MTEKEYIFKDSIPEIPYEEQIKQDNVLSNKVIYSSSVKNSHITRSVFDRGQMRIGGIMLDVDAGENIQEAIDIVNLGGGGSIIFKNGIHLLENDIVLYDDIYLEGANRLAAIIDFQNTAYGILAEGLDAYTTGTITVVAGSTTVTGAGTAWTTDMIGQKILLRGIWYLISDVNVGAQTLTIAIPYAAINLSGFPYTIATPIEDNLIRNITIKNSTASAIKFSYGNESLIENVSLINNTKAVEINSSSGIPFNNVDVSIGTTGFDFNDSHHFTLYACNIIDMTGNAMEMYMCCNSLISGGFIGQITGDGIQIDYTEKMVFHGVTVRQCGGQGVELVSNNSVIEFEGCDISYNTSDGIKLTATTDNCVITHCILDNNGGYGWNIAAATCDNNFISLNHYTSNTSGEYNDSGTGTVNRDKDVSSALTLVQSGTFTDSFNITGLSGNTITSYKLIFRYRAVSGSATLNIRLNNDSGNNYTYTSHYAGESAGAEKHSVQDRLSGQSSIGIMTTAYINCAGEIRIYTKNGNIRLNEWQTAAYYSDDYFLIINGMGVWTNTTDEITQINILMAYTGGANSVVGEYWLYKLK